MRYFIDFEFMEDGRTIDPISLGLVAEDGREFYAEFTCDLVKANEWVKKNVIPKLKGPPFLKTAAMIRKEILAFVFSDKPEFWGYYADYDWVAFCQIFGSMMKLPKDWPMYCRDIKQFADDLGNPKLPPEEKDEHNALSDARWNRKAWMFLHEKDLARIARLVREFPNA